jgi:hypothetical protein
MKRSRLRRHAGMRYDVMNPILDELAAEGKIKMEEEIITLIL